MASRRTRPPQPLAPHGIPGHLVEFVEALRGVGIAVGPSETVDAGRVMTVLGLGDRAALREGLACAVLRRSIQDLCRADHGDDPAVLAAWLGNKTPAQVAGWIAAPEGCLLVAEVGGMVCGVGSIGGDGRIGLNYVAPEIPGNTWTKITADQKQWYLTGAAGTATGCNQVTYCTLAEVKAALPNATLFTVQITKGRDYAYSGAVDALQIDSTTYDFEPFGVIETTS